MAKFDPPEAEQMPPSISEGDYDAICVKVETATCFGHDRKVFLRFSLYGGEYDGVKLFLPCRFPHGKMSPQHKYYKLWSVATGRRPTANEPLDPKVFKNRLYRIRVRNTNRRHSKDAPYPEHMQYSVVDTILEAKTGGKPARAE